MKMKTFDAKKNKYVTAGEIIGDSYHRNVKNTHFMVKYHGYGIQSDIFARLVAGGIKWVILHTKTTNLKSSLLTWFTQGKQDDFGHGSQIFLNTNLMEDKNVNN